MDKYLSASSSLFGSLKNAVLGNPVTREYQVGAQVGSFGPGLCWKVFEGKKKTTGQDVSVFVLEKKVLDCHDKRERETILEVFRKGPQQLAKLRHPRLLTIQHTLEESRDSLAFATEPVFASLANVLGKHDHLPTTVQDSLRQYELYDVEKVYGLLQIAEGLAFLHNDVKLLEGNITPNNIIITKDGQWKLAGFNFSVTAAEHESQQCFDWESRLPIIAKPELNYFAPEYILSRSCTYASDMYSFGCLINAVYNKMKTPFDAGNSIESYKRCIEQLCRFGSEHLQNIPFAVRDHVKTLLNIAPEIRPDSNQTIKHEFFDDVAAMTLKYLHSLVQRDDMTKSQFFKNLHRVITKLPKRVVHQRVLPHLFLEFPNHPMIPFVLPNVFLIAEDCTDQEYRESILPELKKIFAVQEPVQVLLIFMQKMELLLKKTPADDVKNYVLPMVFRALESPSVPIEELVLSIIPNFAHMIDYTSLKNAIIPRIKTLILKTTALSVRVNALICIGKLIEYFDKFMMIDDIFPMLPQIPSKEPAVLMAILGIYKKTIAHKKMNIEKDYLASKALPFLLPIAIDPALNLTQFNNFMSVIREMIDRVDQEHRTKLEQLSQMQDQQKSALELSKTVEDSKDMKEMMAKVDRLVLGSPEKAVDSTGFSEFSKVFGIVDENPSRNRQPKADLMAHSSGLSVQKTSIDKDLTNNLQSEKTYGKSITLQTQVTSKNTNNYESSSIQSDFQYHNSYINNGLGNVTEKENETQSLLSDDRSYGIKKNTGIQNSHFNTVQQQQQHSSTTQNNAVSLNSMLMKNVGLSTAGPYSSQLTMVSNSNKTTSNMAAQSNSLNSILTPEMKQFSSMQQKLSLNAIPMQNQQMQQSRSNGMQQVSMNLGLVGNQRFGTQSQSQMQTFSMHQTQNLIGGIQQPSIPVMTPQQSSNTSQSMSSNQSSLLMPQRAQTSATSTPSLNYDSELQDLLI